MFFKLLANAIVAVAQAFAWHEKNAALRALTDNARELYNAELEYYQLQNGNDGSVDASRIKLSELRVRFLQDHQARLLASSQSDSTPLLSAPGNDPAAGTGNQNKPG